MIINYIKSTLVLVLLISIQSLLAQDNDKYYFNKTIKGDFDDTYKKVKAELKKEGFGIITEIDMDVKLKEKLSDVKMSPYKILGVCNPSYAYETLQVDENIGLFLPCKVLIKDIGNGNIEIVMVNPSALMVMLKNKELENITEKVTEKFLSAFNRI